MSSDPADVEIVSQKHRIHPNSLMNLRRFEPGQSGNPGGYPKGTPKVSVAYAKLLALTPEEIDSYQPVNVAEQIALRQIKDAQGLTKKSRPLPAAQEITDRTEGKAKQVIETQDISEIERLIIRVQERALAQVGLELSRDQAIEQIVAYKPELAGHIK